ncbi:MAG: hypothetical protein M1834_007000 [Cirrosporium novae-zelandiae]|nr:MAG: hypothetical protein M1834_007000 [Cirrosporium novae-zelandiae]
MESAPDEDPTDFEGVILPALPSNEVHQKNPKQNAYTGVSAAGTRALIQQIVRFYFRAPAKSFLPNRVDYLTYAKEINPNVSNGQGWSWRKTTPALLAHAVKTQGWSFIPKQVLPPLLANAGVGSILYGSYLQVLSQVYSPSSQAIKVTYPPPPPTATFIAGFAAGGIQSFVAAPLDALQVRFSASEMLEGQYNSMWQYGKHKLQEIGLRGVFAGWNLSFMKDSLGYGAFFSTFEYVKSQAYYNFLSYYYSPRHPRSQRTMAQASDNEIPTIKPHYAIEPTFLLLAGISAAYAQQLILHPLGLIQTFHYDRLESLDILNKSHSREMTAKNYYHAYQKTLQECKFQARRAGGWRIWLYRNFALNTMRQIPSTSAGLIVFELLRRSIEPQLKRQINISHQLNRATNNHIKHCGAYAQGWLNVDIGGYVGFAEDVLMRPRDETVIRQWKFNAYWIVGLTSRPADYIHLDAV